MATTILAAAGQQYFTDAGKVLSGGKLYWFSTGSSTPVACFSDSDRTTEYAIPLVLDAAGRVPSSGLIYPPDTPSLDMRIDDSDDTVVWGPSTMIACLASV